MFDKYIPTMLFVASNGQIVAENGNKAKSINMHQNTNNTGTLELTYVN